MDAPVHCIGAFLWNLAPGEEEGDRNISRHPQPCQYKRMVCCLLCCQYGGQDGVLPFVLHARRHHSA
eukprot:scaffold27165_cov17-Tisochrysis_lutea.AAC.2